MQDRHNVVIQGQQPDNSEPMRDCSEINYTTSCICKVSTLVVVIIILVTIVSTSFSHVEWNQIAFRKNTFSNTVDRETVYKNGRYFWGPVDEPLVFPSLYQKISYRGNDLLVASGSNNKNNTAAAGLEFGIECDVYYRLEPDNLKELFNDFGTQSHERIMDSIKASIKNTAPEFTVDDYLNRRQAISKRMVEEINNDITDLHVQIQSHHFMLFRVIFPDRVLNKFIATVSKDLDIDTSILNRDVDLYQKRTEELVSMIRSNITIVIGTSDAKATAINETAVAKAEAIFIEADAQARAIVLNAEAESIRIHEEALGNGINHVMSILNATSTETRVKLFQVFTIMDNPGSEQILIGDENTVLNIG